MNEKRQTQALLMFIKRHKLLLLANDNKLLIWLSQLLTKQEMHLKQPKSFIDVERYLEKVLLDR